MQGRRLDKKTFLTRYIAGEENAELTKMSADINALKQHKK
jgi:hypothetical protein